MENKKTIKINETTKNRLIQLSQALNEINAQIQQVGTTYLDAVGETPDGWMLEKDFSAFVKEVPEPEETL